MMAGRTSEARDVRVLVVDDSATMRGLIDRVVGQGPGLTVVGHAADAFEAADAVMELDPDVLTLDVEMPHVNGIHFLRQLMSLRPKPVVMVSARTRKGADTAVEALMHGAFDCVGKPDDGDVVGAFRRLPDLLRAAAASTPRPRPARSARPAPRRAKPVSAATAPAPMPTKCSERILLIGASTGGVDALADILSTFGPDCPPTAIVQHMPKGFTQSFAMRLNQISGAEVREAQDGDRMRRGLVLVAPGGERHLELVGGPTPTCRLIEGPQVNGHRPSADRLFSSAAPLGPKAVGVILTGLGRDGAAGLKQIRDAGGRTFGQDAESSVVFGMPRAAAEIGAVETQGPPNRIAAAALAMCKGER